MSEQKAEIVAKKLQDERSKRVISCRSLHIESKLPCSRWSFPKRSHR